MTMDEYLIWAFHYIYPSLSSEEPTSKLILLPYHRDHSGSIQAYYHFDVKLGRGVKIFGILINSYCHKCSVPRSCLSPSLLVCNEAHEDFHSYALSPLVTTSFNMHCVLYDCDIYRRYTQFSHDASNTEQSSCRWKDKMS